MERLESEIEKNDFLMREQRESTDQQQQELLNSLEANGVLQKQLSSLQAEVDKKVRVATNSMKDGWILVWYIITRIGWFNPRPTKGGGYHPRQFVSVRTKTQKKVTPGI